MGKGSTWNCERIGHPVEARLDGAGFTEEGAETHYAPQTPSRRTGHHTKPHHGPCYRPRVSYTTPTLWTCTILSSIKYCNQLPSRPGSPVSRNRDKSIGVLPCKKKKPNPTPQIHKNTRSATAALAYCHV